jgi:chromate transporter
MDERRKVGLGELFMGFLSVSLSGFGGVLPWAHRTLVEERRWMSEAEFLDMLSLCQFLPGPNIVNVSIYVGSRYHGPLGAAVAFSGLMLAPFALILVLAALYTRWGNVAVVHGALAGVSAAAAGLVVAMGVKMAMRLRSRPLGLAFAALAFIGVGLLQFPLVAVLLVLAPLSIAASAARLR